MIKQWKISNLFKFAQFSNDTISQILVECAQTGAIITNIPTLTVSL